MASGLPLPSSRYEVVVPGRFGPAYLAAFAATGAAHSEVSSVFYLNPPQGMGIPDIAAMLQARGLVILDIRRVDSPAPGTGGQRTPDISHRGPVGGAPRVGARDSGRMGSRRHRPNRGEAAMAHPCFDVPSDDFDEQPRPL